MIGLDTNILVRLFVDEVGPDRKRAETFLRTHGGAGAFFVSQIVMAELVWALRSRYGYDKTRIVTAILSLIDNDAFQLENSEMIRQAATVYAAKRGIDFADALIALAGLAAGCGETVTLDEKAGRLLPEMRLLS